MKTNLKYKTKNWALAQLLYIYTPTIKSAKSLHPVAVLYASKLAFGTLIVARAVQKKYIQVDLSIV